MRKIMLKFIPVLLSLLLFAGCTKEKQLPQQPGKTPLLEQVICDLMALDYTTMTVTEFNKTIENVCDDADTTIFESISDAYDAFAVYDESGEFAYTKFPDKNVEAFMTTTLEYSAGEIFGEPIYQENIAYMTMPDMTALELYQKRETMLTEEWESFYDSNIENISIFPVLGYEIVTDIQSPDVLLVSERDNRINDVRSAVETFLLELDEESVKSETLENDVLTEFERITTQYSDNELTVTCKIQSLERDILEQ